MPTDYNAIADEYKKAKQQPWRMHIEHYTLFELLGDLHGKRVLDLACGEGFTTRFLKKAGAARVVGVDVSEKMIALAREEESRRPLGIEYQVHDARTLAMAESFDVVVAAYLLNYARNRQELLEMCQAVANRLKPGSRFVAVNNNPGQPPEYFAASRPYGFVKSCAGELRDGTPVVYTIFLENGPFDITNYHLSEATHEWAFASAGFQSTRWHDPQVSPEGTAEFGAEYWSPFLHHPPVIFLESVR